MKTKTIIISCLVGFFGFLIVVSIPLICIFENEKRFSDSTQIRIKNKTDTNIIAVIFAVPLSPKNCLSDAKAEKYRMPPDSNELIMYYYGSRGDVNNVLVSVVVWKGTDGNEADIMKSQPYLVKSFYNPESLYVVNNKGEHEYGQEYKVIIEDK
jgi:hypothetical protein